jgi:hypothetical protein
MQTVLLGMAIGSALLLLSTVVVGLWIQLRGEQDHDHSSATTFHMGLGFAAAVFTLSTVVLALLALSRAGP